MTETRVVEQELLKTKEFLERIIQSTVDAIVCADTEGRLTLFNMGGERLFGYKSGNVVGRVYLSDLFPGEEGNNVLRLLHGPQRGGRGRLEPVRVEVLARDGERVPVQLTASLIYDGDEEVGIVAILSDLRERVRMEKRYHEMQERYLRSQKQALVAELAGTTAHELNQPLTSIMGYAELLEKRLGDDGSNRRAVEVIMSEAERMAEIVKKIGKITRYETKAYVGSTQILDLDKSTE
jgi:PAS domain S-box-containing protein